MCLGVVVCKECGKSLEIKRRVGKPRKFCSRACHSQHPATLAREKRRSEVQTCQQCKKQFNGERKLTYCRDCGAKPHKRRNAKLRQRVCNVCNVEFTGTISRTCCDVCGPKKRATHCCKWCFKRFKPSKGSKRTNQYCCREHAFAKWGWDKVARRVGQNIERLRKFIGNGFKRGCSRRGESQPRVVLCRACGEEFAAKSKRRTQCDSCTYSAFLETKRNEYKDAIEPRACADCGNGQIRTNRTIARCDACQLIATRASCKEARKRRQIWKRAGMPSWPKPDFTIPEIYERDGYVCQLCSKRTDPTASHRSNDYPSLDHIIPLSKGGMHTRENVQCAHRGCNSRKGNRVECESNR